MQINCEKIRQFVVDNLVYDRARYFSNDDSFLEEGIVDSTGILELIHILERDYGLTFADGQLTPENFASLNRICAFVGRKLDAAVEAHSQVA